MGGFNDTLCQIQFCLTYAERTSRTLLVDFRGNPFSAAVFTRLKIEDSTVPVILAPSAKLLNSLDRLSVFPSGLSGRVTSYQSEIDLRRNPNIHVELESNQLITFDPDSEYLESVLVHHASGGGTHSKRLLSKLTFTEKFNRLVTENLSRLPDTYDGVHIRASDYDSDYRRTILRIVNRKKPRFLLVCTDNPRVLLFARSLSSLTSIVDFGPLPNQINSAGLHHQESNSSPELAQKNADRLLLELVALARADKLFLTYLKKTSIRGSRRFSGLSELLAFAARNSNSLSLFSGLPTRQSASLGPKVEIVAPASHHLEFHVQGIVRLTRKRLRKRLRQIGFYSTDTIDP